ncbi:unnamed protein product [Trypanosoma congolense IL3000]|uniref:WGS project CAEQ00000000 data, annotated contig 1037 n=1 Tax=Trypanosoma congolense (strain IL3000) TaxID=1068625 RepID=F9W3C6_TRYCI|nr:unnamed protein product [Trypanosoma congolense IL3000]
MLVDRGACANCVCVFIVMVMLSVPRLSCCRATEGALWPLKECAVNLCAVRRSLDNVQKAVDAIITTMGERVGEVKSLLKVVEMRREATAHLAATARRRAGGFRLASLIVTRVNAAVASTTRLMEETEKVYDEILSLSAAAKVRANGALDNATAASAIIFSILAKTRDAGNIHIGTGECIAASTDPVLTSRALAAHKESLAITDKKYGSEYPILREAWARVYPKLFVSLVQAEFLLAHLESDGSRAAELVERARASVRAATEAQMAARNSAREAEADASRASWARRESIREAKKTAAFRVVTGFREPSNLIKGTLVNETGISEGYVANMCFSRGGAAQALALLAALTRTTSL